MLNHTDTPARPFVTRDFRLSAHLKSLGYEPTVVAVDRLTAAFEFATSPALYDAVRAFALGQARVEPITFDKARAELRRALDKALYAAQRDAGAAQ